MKVFPVAGREGLRDPRTRMKISAEGHEVPDNDLFWQRRIAQGDVTVEAPATEQEPKHGGDHA